MKKRNHFLLVAFAIVFGCLFFYKGEAIAAGADFYKKYSLEEFDVQEYTIRLEAKCKLNISIDCPYVPSYDEDDEYWDDEDEYWDDEDEYWDEFDEIYLVIEDSEDEEVYEEYVESFGITKGTVTLPAGKYRLYMDSDLACTVTLSGQYIPELSAKKMTLEMGNSEALQVKGAGEKKVKWKSSDKTVATVSNKGVVKAKKAGKATITATCGKKKLQCSVIVKVSYSDISKKMKAYARKHKNFNFVNQKYTLGKVCRLYGKKISEQKITTEYGTMTEAQPCIELRKYNGKTELHFKMLVKVWKVSFGNVTVAPSKIQISSSNKNLALKMGGGVSDIKHDYETGCDIGEKLEECTISKTNAKSMKKFEAMLRQNSLMIKVRNYDGTPFQAKVDASARENWKKLVKEYRTLLKTF